MVAEASQGRFPPPLWMRRVEDHPRPVTQLLPCSKTSRAGFQASTHNRVRHAASYAATSSRVRSWVTAMPISDASRVSGWASAHDENVSPGARSPFQARTMRSTA